MSDPDAARLVYLMGEREDWNAPRAIGGGFAYDTDSDRERVREAYVEATMGGEYTDVWLALRFVVPDTGTNAGGIITPRTTEDAMGDVETSPGDVDTDVVDMEGDGDE